MYRPVEREAIALSPRLTGTYTDSQRANDYFAQESSRPSDPHASPSPYDEYTPGAFLPAVPRLHRDDSLSLTEDKYSSYESRNGSNAHLNEKSRTLGYGSRQPAKHSKSRKRLWIIGGIVAAVIIVAVAVGAAVARSHSKGKQNTSTGGSSTTSSDDTYGNGAKVTTSDGTTFIYNNSFGGYFRPNAFDFSARPRSDVPTLAESWDFSYMRINGVNLGGWFVLEPFITPALFEPYLDANGNTTVVDEWTLSERLGSNLSTVMEQHYSTFITEIDIAQIAGAGLNWVRLPIPYWFIETFDGEPFLEGVGWKYVLQVLEWCRKYGLRMELDLHALPGSQNGQNHSGRTGTIGFLNGIMGIANAQRSLNYIRTLAEFISQSEYSPMVQIFAIANEVAISNIGIPEVRSFYLEAYKMIRDITGIGSGNGAYMAIHDGFIGQAAWPGFMTGADRLALEVHHYLAYSPADYILGNISSDLNRPCQWWSPGINGSLADFGFTFSGEWCLATNDCGQWVNHIGSGSYYAGNYNASNLTAADGDCNLFTDYPNFTDEFKSEMQDLTQMYMDMARNTFFWAWKMGANSTGLIPNPLWSYSLGLEQGWIPKDPRGAVGACDRIAAELNLTPATSVAWSPPLSAWMTGGSGANTMAAAATSNYTAWPVTTLMGYADVANLYTYTPTGTPITLSASPSSGTISPNGWADASDTAGYYTAIPGCDYPNAYSGAGSPAPTTQCGAASTAAKRSRRTASPATITPHQKMH